MTEKLNSKELRGTILGTLLGDAYVCFNQKRNSARLDIYHKDTFLDLLIEKQSVLQQVGTVSVRITEKIDKRLLESGDTRKGNRLQTTTHPYFAKLGNYPTQQKMELLSPRGLAWFWMDDGSLWWKFDSKNNSGNASFSYAYFAMDSYPDTDVNFFVDYMKDTWNVQGKRMKYLGKGGKFFNRYTMNKENFLVFREVIRPYIVPSMYYKLFSAKELAEWQV